MTAPPIKPAVATCIGKQRYCDEITARAAGSSLIGKGWATVPVLYVYRCQQCRGWHFTRSPQGDAITGEHTFAPRKTFR